MMTKTQALQLAGITKLEYEAECGSGDIASETQNWGRLHPYLAALQPDKHGISRCRAYLAYELMRPVARPFYLDRIYKRMSSLRRDAEWAAIRQTIVVMQEAA